MVEPKMRSTDVNKIIVNMEKRMISEIDIADMKALYELDKGTMFKLAPQDVVSVPPASEEFTMGDVYKFMGIDGMYSKCVDSNGTTHHFAAWTKVTPWVI